MLNITENNSILTLSVDNEEITFERSNETHYTMSSSTISHELEDWYTDFTRDEAIQFVTQRLCPTY